LAAIAEIPELVRTLRRDLGPIYGLVNNAAAGFDGALPLMHNSQIEQLIRLNMVSPIILTKYVVRSMMADGGGRIVNVASIIGFTGYSGLSVYGATKAAMIGFTRSLAREVGRKGVNVNSVAPGFLETAKFADAHGFTAVWTPERHFQRFGGLYGSPSVTGAALAVTTKRISIRAGSVVLPLQNPLRVAEEWAMIDNLSNGRVAISFAPGWHVNDFVLSPDTYQHRHDDMYKKIAIIQKLWRGEKLVLPNGAGTEIEVGIL